jgi:transcriptional regulator with XRE-family HTH domain
MTGISEAHPLTRARLAKGLSREGLAFKSGMSLRAIERLEKGEHLPRRATAHVISSALDCDPVELWPELELAA